MAQGEGCQILCVTHNLAFQQICSSIIQVLTMLATLLCLSVVHPALPVISLPCGACCESCSLVPTSVPIILCTYAGLSVSLHLTCMCQGLTHGVVLHLQLSHLNSKCACCAGDKGQEWRHSCA